MPAIGKTRILVGAVFVVAGVLLTAGAKIPFLGKLPGDFVVERKNFTFYFPLATCIIVSIVLTLVFRFLGR